ncbi:MAG: hypothetical protein LBH43_12020 [Treponema sp.]|jgi:hypothetical protein|nr:hypothetical protein [Treponema sp.]
MVLEKMHEEKILEAVRKAAGSVNHGEVQIKIEQTKNILDVVVITQERVRLERKSQKTA